MQFRFVCWTASSSFVEFRRVPSCSSFRSSSFAPFGAYETCIASHLGPYSLLLSSWVLRVTVARGQVGGLVRWSDVGSFLVESTSIDSVWLASRRVGRIVFPLELETSFVSKLGHWLSML